MPNWCENEIAVSGPDVERVLAAIANPDSDDEDQRILDFDKVIPYPQEYKDMDRRSAEYQSKLFAISRNDPQRDEKLKTLADEYGVEPGTAWIRNGYNAGGYEWCLENWGTKWNASQVSLTRRPINAHLPDTRQVVAFIEFETAWTPPLPVIEKLAEMFPDHTFDLAYYEGGLGFCGQARWVNGQEEFHNSGEYNGRRGG